MNRRRKLLALNPETIVGCLQGRAIANLSLPPDVRIIAVASDFLRQGIVLILESDSFDAVPDGQSLPYANEPGWLAFKDNTVPVK